MLVPASSGGEMLRPAVCALTQWINQCLLASEAGRPGTRIGNSNAGRIIPTKMTAAAFVHYSTVAALTCFVWYWVGMVRSEMMIDVQPSQQWLYDNREDEEDHSDDDEDHVLSAPLTKALCDQTQWKSKNGHHEKWAECIRETNAGFYALVCSNSDPNNGCFQITVFAAKGRDGRGRYKFPGLCSAY